MAKNVAFPGGPDIGELPEVGGSSPFDVLSGGGGIPPIDISPSSTATAVSGPITGDFAPSFATGPGARAGAADALGPLTGENLPLVLMVGAAGLLLILALKRKG